MAKRRVGHRGRVTVALVIGTFLVVTTSVVWRRARGLAAASQLQQLATQLTILQTQRLQLENEIRALSSLSRLGPHVQSHLGMRTPNDSQNIFLPRRPRPDGR